MTELTFFLPSKEGRRSLPEQPWTRPEHAGYMPHLVVEGEMEYLGVRFVGGPPPVYGEPAIFELELMYASVDYGKLQPGAAVTVREGGRTIARGRVLDRK